MPTTELALDNIQGNVIGGFNKDHQVFVFLKFVSSAAGRAWLAEMASDSNELGVASSTSEKVLRFNAQFKAIATELRTIEPLKKPHPEKFIQAEWTSLSISWEGFKALGVKAGDLQAFPQAFQQGMKARADLNKDLDTSAPGNWNEPFKSSAVHAVLLVAADDEKKRDARLAAIMATAAFKAGAVELTQRIVGKVRSDKPGHEHFGFKDGVSQPGIRGIDMPFDPVANPGQGRPGQDLLWPGEFVLGYATQIATADPQNPDMPNPNAGPDSPASPAWTKDGSYLVFRQLQQDVPAFAAQIETLSTKVGLSKDLMGAKLVGRYPSGCPLETRAFQSDPTNPPASDPATQGLSKLLATSDNLNNNFEFGDDPVGVLCPMGSHIRKAYPRDSVARPRSGNPIDSESDTQTHRLLRRGIPFGEPFGADHLGGKNDPRGLVFQCYGSSIERQFEFVQANWIHNEQFPPTPDGTAPGEDPIIAQTAAGPFQMVPGREIGPVAHFVTNKGGEYFLTPSLSALQELGAGAHAT